MLKKFSAFVKKIRTAMYEISLKYVIGDCMFYNRVFKKLMEE